MALHAKWSSAQQSRSTQCVGFKQGRGFHPFFGVGYGGFRGQNTSAMMTNDGIDFKQRVPLHRHFKMEVRLRLNCIALTALRWQACAIALRSSHLAVPEHHSLHFIIVLGKL